MEQQVVTMDEPCFENLPVEVQQHIFSFCGTETRREITLVCKDWAEALRYFHEDFRVYLQFCYLREDLEPVTLLMNSTRRCHSLRLGPEIHLESKEVQNQFFSHLGRDVQVLELSLTPFWEDPDFLLCFPNLKKLTVPLASHLRAFKSFPKTLEHVHLYQLNSSHHLERLPNIKSLKLLTADEITWCHYKINIPQATRICTLDENLAVLFKSYSWMTTDLTNTNLIDAPTITFNDVFGISVGQPSILFSLDIFPNLRKIHVTWFSELGWNPDSFCFNYHQAVLCAGVAELQMNIELSCIECFKSIIDSFPNVKKIGLHGCKLTNQHIKYIFFKLPNLVHLKTNSENLNHEIICYDQPEYSIGNLMQLESLFLPFFVANDVLMHWPFMPHLKEVELGELLDDHVLIHFTKNTPNLESFEIGHGSLLSDTGIELIAKNWLKLRTLRLSSTAPCDLSPIKLFCRNLQTLTLYRGFSVHTYASFFDEIPTLREMRVGDEVKYRYLKEWQGWD